MGRPRKKDPAVVRVAEALAITLEGDPMCLEEIQNFPTLLGVSPKDQGIICMYACGFSQGFIAKTFDMAQPSVWERIQKIDPQGMFKLSPSAKKAFVTRMAESRGIEALSSITFDDYAEASGVEKARIADTMFKISANMNQSKHKEITSGRLDSLIDDVLEAERVSVSASPCEETKGEEQ